MKTLSLFLFALSFTFLDAATMSDNVRAAQTKLKAEGFYFGETDGVLSNDFSAALARYQIRHGLQITSNLNEETSKSLGVVPEVVAGSSSAPPDGDTWRRLRKSDTQFLNKLNDGRKRPAATTSPKTPRSEQTAAQSDSPTKLLEPMEPGNKDLFLLDPERVRDYVGAFVLAGLDPQVGAELEFFADRVRYFDSGIVDREKIATDLKRYAARWPQRRFWLAGDVKVEVRPDSRLLATFPLRFELANGAKHSSGKVQKTLLLEVLGEDLQIVSVNERKL
ncbi:MAG: peptidoglycan-binding domain-containing protein [Spartobacteria bacterium]